jgi:hypothetical protein
MVIRFSFVLMVLLVGVAWGQTTDEQRTSGSAANAAADVSQSQPAEATEDVLPPVNEPEHEPSEEEPTATIEPDQRQPQRGRRPATVDDVVDLLRQRQQNGQQANRPAVVGGDARESVVERFQRLLKEPDAQADPQAVREHLDELIATASELALVSRDGPVRLQAMSVQMQAIYTRLAGYPAAEDFDRMLSRLRATARRTKALNDPRAGSIGDFWLLTAELVDINRSGLSAAERQEQANQLMSEYARRHPMGPPAREVREAQEKLVAQQQQEQRQSDSAHAGPLQASQIDTVLMNETGRLSMYWQNQPTVRALSEQQVRDALTSYRQVDAQSWRNLYVHVAGGDRTGMILLNDGRRVEWLLRPGGLAVLTYPDGRQVYLVESGGADSASEPASADDQTDERQEQ